MKIVHDLRLFLNFNISTTCFNDIHWIDILNINIDINIKCMKCLVLVKFLLTYFLMVLSHEVFISNNQLLECVHAFVPNLYSKKF